MPNEMIKTTKNSKSGYNKKIEILKRIQDDIKQNWKAQLPNQKFQGKSWLVRNDRAEEKMLGPEGKVEKLDHEIKEYHPLVKHIWKEHMQDDFNRVQSEKWPRLISLFFLLKKKRITQPPLCPEFSSLCLKLFSTNNSRLTI